MYVYIHVYIYIRNMCMMLCSSQHRILDCYRIVVYSCVLVICCSEPVLSCVSAGGGSSGVQDVVDTHLQAVAGRAALQPVMGGKFAQQVCSCCLCVLQMQIANGAAEWTKYASCCALACYAIL